MPIILLRDRKFVILAVYFTGIICTYFIFNTISKGVCCKGADRIKLVQGGKEWRAEINTTMNVQDF
jgi:hypothetical protein